MHLKDIIPDGDCPVVWTNKNYSQNSLIISGFRWLVASDQKGNVFE